MSNHIITSDLLKDEPELIDLIDRFISRLPEIQKKISNAHDIKDWDNFIHFVHQMKGVGGNYGYHVFTELCAEIELLAYEKKYSEVNEKLDQFNITCEKIVAGREENHKIAEQHT